MILLLIENGINGRDGITAANNTLKKFHETYFSLGFEMGEIVSSWPFGIRKCLESSAPTGFSKSMRCIHCLQPAHHYGENEICQANHH